jgi:hypothetical protein
MEAEKYDGSNNELYRWLLVARSLSSARSAGGSSRRARSQGSPATDLPAEIDPVQTSSR